jgi:hypothetical protein
MKPRTKVRILSSAPPQYHGKTGWIDSQQGAYWTVTFEGGGHALLHATEIEPVDSPAAAEPEPSSPMDAEPGRLGDPVFIRSSSFDGMSALHRQQAADFARICRLPPKPNHD